MYTYCVIQYIDDDSELYVIIKSNEEIDRFDEHIFFYGLPREALVDAFESGRAIENEWKVVEVGETFDTWD